MKTVLLSVFVLTLLTLSTHAQKSVTQAFSPSNTFESIYNTCLEVTKAQHYVVKSTDPASGIIEAEKSADGTPGNRILLSLSMKTSDDGEVVCFLTVSKKGKVKSKPEEFSESFIYDIGSKVLLVRLGKDFKG